MNTTEELRAAFDFVMSSVERKRYQVLARRADAYRRQGWHDLADVIENEEGKRIVQYRMQHIIDWMG